MKNEQLLKEKWEKDMIMHASRCGYSLGIQYDPPRAKVIWRDNRGRWYQIYAANTIEAAVAEAHRGTIEAKEKYPCPL